MTFKKPLMIATLTAAVALGAVSQKAEAADPVLGAIIGGGIGAGSATTPTPITALRSAA